MYGRHLLIGLEKHMDKIQIDKKNEVYMLVQSEPGVEQEISEYFTFFVPGYRFMPSFKNKMWDVVIMFVFLLTKGFSKIAIGIN